MRLSAIAAALALLVSGGTALAETQPCCQRAADADVPLVPIPDPTTWEPQAQQASSYSHPPGLQPGDKYHLIFATSFQTNIDSIPSLPPVNPFSFGSLEAGDWVTTVAAHWADLPGMEDWDGLEQIYTALLSIDGMDARDRITIEAPVYNTGGQLIALDADDLWDGSIENPVGFDEEGNGIEGDADVWTGTVGDGTWSHPLDPASCGNWDTPGPFESGETGDALYNDSFWIQAGTQTCSMTARLYGVSPAITVPEPSCLCLLFVWRCVDVVLPTPQPLVVARQEPSGESFFRCPVCPDMPVLARNDG